MIRGSLLGFVGLFIWMPLSLCAQDASLGPAPRVLDERLKLELFAEHPTLVTPTGIDVDHLGRVWVLESNTHFPPDGYQGHPSDRLLVLQDTDDDGKADKTTVFADGFKFAMSVAVQPVWLADGLWSMADGKKKDTDNAVTPADHQPSTIGHQPHPVFVATRGEIVRLLDINGDLVADERTRLVHLETAGNYPHNGLAGIAFDALGWMYFGFGENLGADYKIIGSDGVTLSGGGEGGNMYRCRPDGAKLEKWATGFWNPHASCFDAFGRLFTVDNDPDSRPPCRLLHIIPGGDYGYRFRNGRRGTHPFTAWNGEIPGTLPMVSGTGEAPSGIVCYESDGFPADYLGTLLVGSWGDHRIDQFVLEAKGASFVSKPKPIVQGTENFRPVGLALAPDGSVYFSDWVLRDYKLHRKGRVWRLSAKDDERSGKGGIAAALVAATTNLPGQAIALSVSPRLTERRLAARMLAANEENRPLLLKALNDPDMAVRARVEALWALSWLSRDTVDLKFVDGKESPVADWPLDEVRVVAAGLFQTPQFELRPYGDRHPRRVLDLLSALRKIEPPTKAGVPLPSDFLAAEMMMRYFASPVMEDEYRKTLLSFRMDGNSFGPHADAALITSISFDARQEKWTRDVWDRFLQDSADDANKAHARLLKYLAARLSQPQSIRMASAALRDRDPNIQRVGIQWVGEEKLSALRKAVESLLADAKFDSRLLMPCLATLSLLDGVPPAEFEKTPPVVQLMKIVADDQRPAALRATALQMVPASTAELSTKLLLEFAKSDDAGLKTQAVRTLQQSGRAEGIPLLLEIAADENAETSLRLDAIAGLCATPHDQPLPANIEQLLLDSLNNRLRFRAAAEQAQYRLEAIRALRGRGTSGSKIGEALRAVRETASGDRELVEAIDLAIEGKSSLSSSDSQLSTLNSQLAPDSGRRVFYHHQGPLCFKCHTVNGRGGNVGPDLSVIARTMNREKLLGSILEPSKEISPQFLTWTITTDDGKTHNGIIVTENGGGDVELGDIQGNITKIPRKSIEERAPSNVSVMPQGLHQRMTSRELSDLLDYLETLK